MRWWLALGTASFLGLFTLSTSAIVHPRRPVGVSFDIHDDQVSLVGVVPGWPAHQAGIRDGDRLISVGGLRIRRGLDVRVMVIALPADAPWSWEVERAGRPLTIVTAAPGRTWSFEPLTIATLGLSLTLGIVLAWRRAHDPTALLGAWLLASLGTVMAPVGLRSIAAAWRDLPAPIGIIISPALLSSALVPALLFAFAARVPRPLCSRRTVLVATLPIVGVAIYMTVWVLLAVYDPPRAIVYPRSGWISVAGPMAYPVYLAGAMALFAINWRGTTDQTERRRARILLCGTASGALGLLPIALTFATDQRLALIDDSILIASALLFALLPLSFAYAILRHRLFDLRIIVRLGLQYALLRGALLALVPLAIVFLAVDVLRHGDQPVRAVLVNRGWTYLALAGAAVVVHSRRRPWMTALDRRFFREEYAAQQVLRQVVEDVAHGASLDDVKGRVLAQLDSALHPRVTALLQRGGDDLAFHVLAVVPPAAAMPPLPAASALVGIVRALGKAVTLSADSASLRRDLPPADLKWLADADVELIVPVAVSEGPREVLLALGPRLSEEPYSQEDLELLGAIASSLAIVTRAGATRDPLGGRYRIDRLLGEGGMGRVWEAYDRELDRVVAIKRLKTTDVATADEVGRFKREARAAARLAHPNIVVVHDFGVDAEHHAFLVMERLSGRTLRERLRTEGRLPLADAIAIARASASGIAAAHGEQLVHRDLKPENIFLCGDQKDPLVKILDFGIARSLAMDAASTHTATGALAGTLLYMAPEQLAGGVPQPSWDLWSLAVVTYEMLAGAHPLSSTETFHRIAALAAGRIEAIRTHVPDAPDSWTAFFGRALALDPADRPRTASEFRDALDELKSA